MITLNIPTPSRQQVKVGSIALIAATTLVLIGVFLGSHQRPATTAFIPDGSIIQTAANSYLLDKGSVTRVVNLSTSEKFEPRESTEVVQVGTSFLRVSRFGGGIEVINPQTFRVKNGDVLDVGGRLRQLQQTPNGDFTLAVYRR